MGNFEKRKFYIEYIIKLLLLLTDEQLVLVQALAETLAK